MRPYDPHIGPDLGGDISAKAADKTQALALWKDAVTRIVYDALVDNFETENAGGVAALEAGDKPRALAIGNAALEKVLAPLSRWTGHDWIGQTLGVADPTDEDGMARLFRYASKTCAEEACAQGIAAKGSDAKFLSSEYVIPKGTKTVTHEDPNKPFIDFLSHVVAQASDTFGDDWVAAKLAENTPEAADTLLQCAGYELNDNNRASLAHAITLLPPDKPADNVVSIQEAPASQDFATARAEGMEPASAPGGLTVEQAVGVIRTKSGLGDPDIGALLGVSRGTVGNVAAGKAKKPLTPEGKLALATKVAEIIMDLTAAKSALEA